MEHLILEAKRGDSDAFTALMQSQMQNMYKAARAILNSDEDAADAIADTILICWEKLGQLKTGTCREQTVCANTRLRNPSAIRAQ